MIAKNNSETNIIDKNLDNQKVISRELVYFFCLTFAISWIVWFLIPFVYNGDLQLLSFVCLIGAFGPSISAIIVTSRGDLSFKVSSTRKRCIIFVITCILAFCILFVIFGLIWSWAFSVFTLICIIILSLLAAFVLSGKYSSYKSTSELLKTIMGIKGKNFYVLIAFLLPIGICLGGLLIYLILGGTVPSNFNFFYLLLLLALNTVLFPMGFLSGGPLNEESGWRGFATPRFQKRFSPITTGLIIGIIWSIWHLPLHFNGFYGDGLTGFLIRFMYNVPFGIIFTWFYNRSRGNLLGCVVLHTSFNTYLTILVVPAPEAIIYSVGIIIVLSIIIIVYDKMWKKIIPDNKAKNLNEK